MNEYSFWRNLDHQTWFELRENPEYDMMFRRAVGRHLRQHMRPYGPTAEELEQQQNERRRQQEQLQEQQQKQMEMQAARAEWNKMRNWMINLSKKGFKKMPTRKGRGWRRRGWMPRIYEDYVWTEELKLDKVPKEYQNHECPHPKLDISLNELVKSTAPR